MAQQADDHQHLAKDDKQHIVKSYDDEINALQRQIIQMGGLVEKQVSEAIRSLRERDVEVAAHVIEQDDQVDQMEEDIDKEVIRILATRQPMAVDLRLVAMATKISNDLERIGDYAANMAKRAISLAKHPPLKPLYTIPHMGQITPGDGQADPRRLCRARRRQGHGRLAPGRPRSTSSMTACSASS